MFENLNFWANWSKKQKSTLTLFFVLALLSIVALIIAYYSGGSFIISWEDYNTTKPVRILFDKFQSGLYEFSIFADQYVITRTQVPGDSHINTTYAYMFLGLFTMLIVFLYAIATSLSRFYFVLSSVFFALILLMFRFENLQVFGFYGKEVYAGILVLFFGIAYYMHAIQIGFSLFVRFIVLFVITIGVCLVLNFFSQVENPFLYISSYLVVAPLILSVIFILLLGFEIVRGFFLVVSQSEVVEGRNSFVHFAIITIFYLGVLTLIFLHKHHYIEWKIVFLDAVWILVAASAIGFWGFRKKEEFFEHIFPFKPFGAYIYIILAIICFSSYAYFFTTANDPFIDIIDDAILITQMSYGLLFLVYIIANFLPAMAEGHAVHKVLYKPKFMPYFSAKLAALVGVVALFFVIKMAPYYQAYAGYYISLAQLFKAENEHVIASEYFRSANVYGRQTHFGNYGLAEIAESNNNYYNRDRYLAIAINTHPTDYVYAKFAHGYQMAKKPFDEVFTLKNGVNQFPDSGPLHNNLGLSFSAINIIDTSVYHLRQALSKNVSEEAASINLPAVLAKSEHELNWDSLENVHTNASNIAVKNNISVLFKKNNHSFPLSEEIVFNASASIDQLVYNYTLLFENPLLADSASWNAYKNYYEESGSINFSENLEYAFAHAFAKSGKSIAALRILRSLNSEDAFGYSEYDLLIAQILMKYGAAEMAIPYFEKTLRFYDAQFAIQYAIALMESQQFEKAASFLEQLSKEGNPPQIISDLLSVTNIHSIDEIVEKQDVEKYNYLYYRGKPLSPTQFEGVIISMEEEGYKYAAYIHLINLLLDLKDYKAIEDILAKINVDGISTQHLKISLLKSLIRYYWNTDQHIELETIIDKYEANRLELGAYYLLASLSKETENQEGIFEELGSYDAFCEEGILASAKYFTDNKEEIKAYNILLDAIEWNQYSIPLNKAYIKSAIYMGLDSYADDVIERLDGKINPLKLQELQEYAIDIKEEIESEW